ncbi:MAG: DUF4238 domain-containing protein [Promethearchaeota archaeon]
MIPKIHHKIVIDEYITTGLVMGDVVFFLKCKCNNVIRFKFLKKRSELIYCDKCNRLAFKLIYHNESEITIRMYFNNTYKDYELKNDTKNHFITKVIGQHEFSKMYLKNFCVSNTNNIFVYNKKLDSVERRNIKSFTKTPFLYDKEIPQLTEAFLSLIENEISPYFSEIIKSNKLFNPQDSPEMKDYKKTLLFRFIILLHLRRRFVKKLIFDKLVQLKSMVSGKLIFENIEFEQKFKMKDSNGIETYNELVQLLHKRLIRAITSQEHLYRDYKMKLLINNTSIPFVISDNPIIKIDGIERKNLLIPSKIYFPLSIKHYILLIHPDKYQGSIKVKLNEKEINKLNYWQYSCSKEYIISNLQNIKEYIKKISKIRLKFHNLPLCFFGFKPINSNQELSLFI